MSDKKKQNEEPPIDALLQKQESNVEQDSEDDEAFPQVKTPKTFLDHKAFDAVVGLVIVMNAVSIALETNDTVEGSKNADLYKWVEIGFCFIFTGELGLKLYMLRMTFFTSFKNRGWNMVDLTIVLLSIVDSFVLAPMNIGDSVRFVQVFRFARLLRLLRLIRLFKIFSELWVVASAIMQTMRTVVWMCMLIVVLCFIVGSFTTYAIGHDDALYDGYFAKSKWDHEVYFGTIGRSIFTLVQVVTLDDWQEGVVGHVVNVQPAMLLIFIPFIAIISFGLLNILIGVIVESTMRANAEIASKGEKQKEIANAKCIQQLREVFEAADTDGSGALSLREVTAAMKLPELYNKLKMVDFPMGSPEVIFNLLDFDMSGELTIEEFVIGAMRMKGSAKSKDLVAVQIAMDALKLKCMHLEEVLLRLQSRLDELMVMANAVVFQSEHTFLGTQEFRIRHPSFTALEVPLPSESEVQAAPWFHKDAAAARGKKRLAPLFLEDTKSDTQSDAQPESPSRLQLARSDMWESQSAISDGNKSLASVPPTPPRGMHPSKLRPQLPSSAGRRPLY